MNPRKKQIIGMALGGLLILLSPVIGYGGYWIGMSVGHVVIRRHYQALEPRLDEYALTVKRYVMVSSLTVGLLSLATGFAIVRKSMPGAA